MLVAYPCTAPSGYAIIDRATSTVAVPVSGGGMIAVPEHNLAIE